MDGQTRFACDRDERIGGVVVASFMQGPFLQIRPGDYAEVVLPTNPGRVFPGMVHDRSRWRGSS